MPERAPRQSSSPSPDVGMLSPEESIPLEAAVRDAWGVMEKSGVFAPEYLRTARLAIFDLQNKPQREFHEGKFTTLDPDTNLRDFIAGKRTDFVGIATPEFLETYGRNIKTRQLITHYLLPDTPTYPEFIAHEMGHNVFDQNYTERYGAYITNEAGETDVADKYRETIKPKAAALLKKYQVAADASRFHFKRQQIAEIAAAAYQRELCRRGAAPTTPHGGVEERIRTLLTNPAETLRTINERHQRSGREGAQRETTLDDFYEENHNLSLVLVPLLEKEYPDWGQRQLFWQPLRQ